MGCAVVGKTWLDETYDVVLYYTNAGRACGIKHCPYLLDLF